MDEIDSCISPVSFEVSHRFDLLSTRKPAFDNSTIFVG